MEASAIEVRLRNQEARLEASHKSISTLRDVSARHETEIKVTTTEVRETREDISEIRKAMERQRQEQKDELTWFRRALIGATITFLMAFIAALALVLQAAAGA